MITHNIAPETPAMTCFYCVMATGYFPDDFDVPLCAKHQDDLDLFNGIPTLWVGYGYFDRNPQEAFALKIDNHDTD